MKICTRSILSPPKDEDGTRISVMSRHTLSDGLTPDVRIIEGVSYDEWLQEVAPPAKMVGAYYRNELTWNEYEYKYLEFLRDETVRPFVLNLAKRASKEPLTLLCIEETTERCHRRPLAEELKRINPELLVEHK